MGIERSVAGSAGEALSLSVGNVFSGSGISVAFGKTEVDDVDEMLALPEANYEVIGFDIAMEEIARMDEFDAREHLVGKHEDSLERELAAAVGE